MHQVIEISRLIRSDSRIQLINMEMTRKENQPLAFISLT